MLRVAVVTRYFPSSAEPWQGRSAYQTLRLLAQMAEVKVFYPNAAYPRLLQPSSRSYQRLDADYRPEGVTTSYHDFFALPLLSRPVNGWMAAQALLPHVRAFAPDLLLSFFLYPDGYAALRIGRALAIPVVVQSIGSDINRIGDPMTRRHTRTVLKEADFLLTVSDDLRAKAVSMGAPADKCKSHPNGCDLSVFHVGDRRQARDVLGLPADAEAVLYIGRIDVRKGLRELVEAACQLRSHRPRLQVYLVGAGPDQSLLKQRIAEKAAQDFIHLLPSCAPAQVAVWMTAANLVTLPSYMEGYPNVLVEALACGRPVVATRVGGIPEIISDDCGCLVNAQDTDALAEALEVVLDKAWDEEQLAARGGRSWHTVAEELLATLESVLANMGRKAAS